jgi:hypothetical protein
VRPGEAVHAVPAFVPEARGLVTHFVEFDYPKAKGDSVTMSERVPCCGEGEAQRIAASNRKLKMRNVRVVPAVRS